MIFQFRELVEPGGFRQQDQWQFFYTVLARDRERQASVMTKRGDDGVSICSRKTLIADAIYFPCGEFIFFELHFALIGS